MYLVISKCVTAVKVSNFSGHYLRNRSTLDIGVLGYIGIVQHKEHSSEVLYIPPGTPCIQTGFRHMNFHYECATKYFQLQTPCSTSYMTLCQQLSHFLHSFLLTHYAQCQNTFIDILSSMISRSYQSCRNISQAGKESLFQSVNCVFIWLHSITHLGSTT